MKMLLIAVSALCLAAPLAANAQKQYTGQLVSVKSVKQVDMTLVETTPLTTGPLAASTFDVDAVVIGDSASVGVGSAVKVPVVQVTVIKTEDAVSNCQTTFTAPGADNDTIAGSFDEVCNGASVEKGAFHLELVTP